MDKQKDWEKLDQIVADLLAHADKLRELIDFHEFDIAEMVAKSLARGCNGANKLANRLADSE